MKETFPGAKTVETIKEDKKRSAPPTTVVEKRFSRSARKQNPGGGAVVVVGNGTSETERVRSRAGEEKLVPKPLQGTRCTRAD